jgi:hypothetical protein
MPNWCDNFLEIFYDSKNSEQVAYITSIKKAVDASNLLDFLKPMPKHQPDLNKPNPFFAKGGLGIDQQPFGRNNWYDWSVDNWGTKWDVNDASYEDFDNRLSITFLSAWSPPTLATMVLADKGFVFVHYYFESGIGFYGIQTNNGDNSADIDFSCSDIRNSGLVRDSLIEMCDRHDIDSAIVDIFGMEFCFHNPDADDDEAAVGSYEDNEEDDDDSVVEGA